MGYKINLGAWQGVFAVPTELVDKHIKIAGAAQLKVLLWLLRNNSEPANAEDIGKALNMHVADVRDCMQFWIREGLIAMTDDEITPSAKANVTAKVTTAFENNNRNTVQQNQGVNNEVKKEKPQLRSTSRPQRPDTFHVAKRISEDQSLAGLVSEAEVVLGRTLSGGDTSTLIMLHDNDGLPADVILMILQYAVSQDKNSMRYIEKVGISWASEEINTLERAEEHIKKLSMRNDTWKRIAMVFGINTTGSPTKFQLDCASRWVTEWKYSTQMIRQAYEMCVDQKGEYNLKYIDGIIKKWYKTGIFTEKDLQEYRADGNKKSTKGAKKESRKASYDINEVEKLMNDFD